MSHNACILRRESKETRFPAKIYGYLALCKEVKDKNPETHEETVVVLGNLPLVSEMTRKSSPEGVLHACWSFLKY